MGPSVLLVDDESGFVDYTAKRLTARGLTVRTALSGEAALKTVQAEPIDVVILDILMPGKNGLETLIEIKRLKPQTQVVMLTGHGTQQSADQGKEHGALMYLLKPADFSSLLDAIEVAYQERNAAEDQQRSIDSESTK